MTPHQLWCLTQEHQRTHESEPAPRASASKGDWFALTSLARKNPRA
jgi:hypothetical protein